jgi:two-component system, LytTR family, response regulator
MNWPLKIPVPIKQGILFIKIEDIICFQSFGNYAYVYLMNDSKILILKNLKWVETKIFPFRFARIHQQFLINMQNIDKYTGGDGGEVIMVNKVKFPVARNHKKDFLLKINAWEMPRPDE